MKNIFLMPTDKPSKIGYHFDIIKEGRLDYAPNFGFPEFNKERNFQHNPQHLYIISDEEIKDDEYYLSWQDYYNPPKYVIYVKSSGVNGNGKKIILTTDPELIADGVQSIDDIFLEWFVKNPSCEFVEVEKDSIIEIKEISYEGDFQDVEYVNYKIFIPQEEPKQGYSKSETKFLGIQFTLKDGTK
jgi:hypothetical protein